MKSVHRVSSGPQRLGLHRAFLENQSFKEGLMSGASEADEDALRKELERQWLATLGRESEEAVANDENFFEAGGQSLETIALYESITACFGDTITYADFLDVIADSDFGGLCRLVIM